MGGLCCRLWFVRMPKPAEDAGTGGLEQEIEGLRTQVQLLNESLAIKRVRLLSFLLRLLQTCNPTMSTSQKAMLYRRVLVAYRALTNRQLLLYNVP